MSDERHWADAFDRYESVLIAQRAMLEALDRGQDVDLPSAFEPPQLLGSVPAALQTRARRLLDETSALVLLAQDLDRAARPRRSGALRIVVSGGPTVLDRSL